MPHDDKAKRPLYNLIALNCADRSEPVFFVEGEKCAEAARSCGLLATTSAGGNQAAKLADYTPLKGRTVYILPDHDAPLTDGSIPGEVYAADVATMCRMAEARSVAIVRLHTKWTLPQDGSDIADLVETHKDDDPIDLGTQIKELARSQSKPTGHFHPFTLGELTEEETELRTPVTEGLVRIGEVMNIVAAPKTGKSWLVHGLSMCSVSGRPWLGRSVRHGQVLLIDGELHRPPIHNRLRTTQEKLGTLDSQVDQITIVNLRSTGRNIHHIAEWIAGHPPGTWPLIIIDPIYRFYPPGFDENSNESMSRLYDTLDGIADSAQAALTIVHHTSKGNQGEKSNTDVGAGAGAQSRAADAHMTLRQHEEEDAVIVTTSVRSFVPIEPYVIRSTRPGWELDPGLDPSAFHKPGGRRGVGQGRSPEPAVLWTPEKFAREIVGIGQSSREAIVDRAVQRAGLSKQQAKDTLKIAVDNGCVVEINFGANRSRQYTATKGLTP